MRLLYKTNRSLAALKIFNMVLPLSMRLITLILFVLFSYAGSWESLVDLMNICHFSIQCLDTRYSTIPSSAVIRATASTIVLLPSQAVSKNAFKSNFCQLIHIFQAAGNFNQLGCAQLVMFQVLTTSNWQGLNSNVMDTYQTRWTAPFFMTRFWFKIFSLSIFQSSLSATLFAA